MSDTTKQLALVRGNGMNHWEGMLWNNAPSPFAVTGFCAAKNLFPIDELAYPLVRLPTSTDSRIGNRLAMWMRGEFQRMRGLEQALAPFSIAHTVELYTRYTWQAVRAKKMYPALKVAVTVWDNSFGRFEYNYWGNGGSPAWWRRRIHEQIAEVVTGADIFLPVSEYSAALLGDYGVPSNKIRVLVPGVLASVPDAAVMERYRLKPSNFFLMVNRLKKEKGVYDVLYAWKIFCRTHPNATQVLVIAGQGPERDTMLRLVNEWGLTERVVYVSTIPNSDVRQLAQYARGLILASMPTPVWQEQFGYVLAEAIMSGCPIVSTLTGAIPDVVQDAGILVPPAHPPALAAAIATLTEDAPYERYHAAALGARERLSAERFRSELWAVYRHLL